MPRKRKAPDPAAEEARKRRKAEAERQRRAARGEEGRRAATEAQRQRRARRGEEGRRAEAEAKRRERARRGDEGRRAATEAQRRRRARLGEEGRRAEAEAKRKERANRTEERRAAEVAAKRRRRAERRKQQRDAEDSASSDFNTSFDDYPCSASCDVCHRLWFKLDVSNVQKEWLPLLLLEFPGEDVASFKVCPSCRSSLSSNKVPSLSRSNDFIQPPMPAHLPQLNLVEERLVPPRTPFLQVRRLFQGVQSGICVQVVSVVDDVNPMVKLPKKYLNEDYALYISEGECQSAYRRCTFSIWVQDALTITRDRRVHSR